VGTSASNPGGTGGHWTRFKREASTFARFGGEDRAARVLAGYVAAAGGAATATEAARAGAAAGQSLAAFLSGSIGFAGIAEGLQAVGLGYLIGADRATVLTTLLDTFTGSGSNLEAQAARDALLDILDEVLPDDGTTQPEQFQLDESTVVDFLQRYLASLVYNRAIPIIDERLTLLQNPQLAQQRDQELREYIHALVRLKTADMAPLMTDWHGSEGLAVMERMLQSVHLQAEAWE